MGVKYAKENGFNIVIIDTAGRLAVDEDMMKEISDLKKIINPTETLFVVDSMTGQDAVNTAKSFNEKVDFDGVSFDTRSWYDTINKRFTPQEAGYYWCQAFLVKQVGETQVNSVFACIYKNGSNAQCNYYYDDWPWYTMQMAFEVSMPVYLNGSTDYVEVHFEWGANGTLGLYSGGSYGQGSKFHIFKMDQS